jgi:glycosyltransferase involved in cell wall biosynthesis
MTELVASGKVSAKSNIWLVDDGSRDNTWALIQTLARESELFVGIKLSRNRGHQHALLAGLLSADGDAVISLDADLQDDLSAVEQMVDAYLSGYEVVYGVRSKRERDTWFKRWSAERYYGLLRALGVAIIPNHADYRLMGRAALTALADYPEVNLFLRGIIPSLGFKSTQVFYDRSERCAGESKYPLPKMLAMAVDGVTSFSPVPLRIIAILGAGIFVVSLVTVGWVLFVRLLTDRAVPGWASITLPIYCLGGLQLLGLGVVGEYVAKVYLESKRRPRFIVEHVERRRASSLCPRRPALTRSRLPRR